jgi:hypothetical protein
LVGLCLLGSAAVLAVSGSVRTAPSPSSAWGTYGGSTSRAGYSPLAVRRVSRGFVIPVSGRITGQVLAGDGLFFATSTGGDVVAFDRNGTVFWRDNLGQLAHSCGQLDGYGVVGTGVIDPGSHTLYVADAFGRLHALALATGIERSGYPIRMFPGFDGQLAWGALTLAGGSVYVPTASYCDTPGTYGGVHAVDLATRAVTDWRVVPRDQGGGGGPWGWGGLAFDPVGNALFAATSGAFAGGSNTGRAFTETAGWGDRLVQLSLGLSVQSSSHPPDLPDGLDLDFVGSPLLVQTPACGKMVVAATKNDTVYGWKQDDLASSPLWTLPIEPYAIANPYVGQLAWSPRTTSVYAVTGTQFVRIKIGPDCSASIVWRRPLGTHTENGSPTVAGNTVWFADNGEKALVGYDATSGRKVFQTALAGTTVQAPTVVPGRIVIGTFSGVVDGFVTSTGAAAAAKPPAPRPTSWADADHRWQIRPDGVYATENSGRTWRRIYAHPALAIARISTTSGVISTGSTPGTCMCTTRQLWTTDNGGTWRETPTLTGSFVASGTTIYFWTSSTLKVLDSLPKSGQRRLEAVATLAKIADGTIVAAAATATGAAILVSSRVAGQGWDTAPRVIIANGVEATTVTLPRRAGHPLARTIRAQGETITVTATDFTDQPADQITWTSKDAGATWAGTSG